MAEEAEDILEDDAADGPEDGGSKRKKLILFIVLPLLLLIGVGVVACYAGTIQFGATCKCREEQTQVEEVVAPTVQTTFLKYRI